MNSSRPNSPATISSLPDEVLWMILSYFDGSVDTYTGKNNQFHSFSMTSRPFHRVASEYLYKWCKLQPETSRDLLRTAITSPSLSSLIKEVEIGCCASGISESRSREDLALFIAKVRELRLPHNDEKRWIRQLSRGVESAEAALLLLQAPNIKSLVVGDQFRELNRQKRGPFRKPPFWMQLIIWATDELPLLSVHSFSALSRAHINMASSRQTRLAHIWRIFRLPSIKAVTLVSAVEYDSKFDQNLYMDLLESHSSVEELYFEDCVICDLILATIITSCKALRCFDYDFVMDSPHPMEFSPIGRALQEHHQSLETLKLGCTYSWDIDSVYPFRSLKGFQRLTHIQADFGAILRNAYGEILQIADILPKSV